MATVTVEFSRTPDPDGSELAWCAYAWPVRYAEGSRRTFFLDGVTGDIFVTDAPEYEAEHGPAPDAAYLDCGPGMIVGATARGTTGRDGRIWRNVN